MRGTPLLVLGRSHGYRLVRVCRAPSVLTVYDLETWNRTVGTGTDLSTYSDLATVIGISDRRGDGGVIHTVIPTDLTMAHRWSVRATIQKTGFTAFAYPRPITKAIGTSKLGLVGARG